MLNLKLNPTLGLLMCLKLNVSLSGLLAWGHNFKMEIISLLWYLIKIISAAEHITDSGPIPMSVFTTVTAKRYWRSHADSLICINISDHLFVVITGKCCLL